MEPKKKTSKRWLFVIGGGVLLTCLCVFVIAQIIPPQGETPQKSTQVSLITEQISDTQIPLEAGTNTPAPTKTSKPTATKLPTRPPTETPNPHLVKAGIHLVNEDIKPGIYWGAGACYWERLKDVTGGFESIIANGNTDGQFYIEVKDSDFAFNIDCEILPLESLPAPSGEFPEKVGPGIYLVGRDIRPGIYRGEGACYWERLKDVSGDFEAITANDNTDGQFYIEVKDSDFAFKIDCEILPLESLPAPSGEIPEKVGPGIYLVGRDIQPGIYRGEGACYWERLKDVSGDFEAIIANDNTDGQFYVEVKNSDFAFNIDCEVERSGN